MSFDQDLCEARGKQSFGSLANWSPAPCVCCRAGERGLDLDQAKLRVGLAGSAFAPKMSEPAGDTPAIEQLCAEADDSARIFEIVTQRIHWDASPLRVGRQRFLLRV